MRPVFNCPPFRGLVDVDLSCASEESDQQAEFVGCKVARQVTRSSQGKVRAVPRISRDEALGQQPPTEATKRRGPPSEGSGSERRSLLRLDEGDHAISVNLFNVEVGTYKSREAGEVTFISANRVRREVSRCEQPADVLIAGLIDLHFQVAVRSIANRLVYLGWEGIDLDPRDNPCVQPTSGPADLFAHTYPLAVPRVSFLLLVIAVTVALPAPAAPTASGAGPEQGTVVLVDLSLEADNGLHAHLENSEDGIFTLEFRRESQSVTYEVPGEATESGFKVRFGRLGLIDVVFTPTETLNSTAPGKGCTGAPRTLREGVFTGTIHFTGEREFVRIEGQPATGSLSVISQWECPEAEATDPFARTSHLLATTSRAEKDERESATLSAIRSGFSSYFVAGVAHRHSGGKSIFLGAKIEIREGMRIWRATVVRGRASAFDFDHAEGTAALHPPAPFSGHASFAARPHGRGLWRSTIRVPLLGAKPIDTGDPGFRVTLRPEYQFD